MNKSCVAEYIDRLAIELFLVSTNISRPLLTYPPVPSLILASPIAIKAFPPSTLMLRLFNFSFTPSSNSVYQDVLVSVLVFALVLAPLALAPLALPFSFAFSLSFPVSSVFSWAFLTPSSLSITLSLSPLAADAFFFRRLRRSLGSGPGHGEPSDEVTFSALSFPSLSVPTSNSTSKPSFYR